MAKAGSKHRYHKPSRAMIFGGIFVATLTTALLSFISLELALLGFGLFALAGLVYSESRRRGFWEQAASFKFKTLKKDQDALAIGLSEQERELEGLRGEMHRIMERVEEIRNSKKPGRERPIPAHPIEPVMDMQADDDPMPLALRAAQSLKPKPYESDEYEGISDNVVQELLRLSVAKDHVDVFVQPIVRLPQRQKRFYEVFARIRARPGQYLPAARYMKLAEQDNLHYKIDRLLLLHCLKTIQTSAHIKNAMPFFINITSDTLKNKAFMNRLLSFVSTHRDLAPRLIFEIRQDAFEDLHPALLEVLKGLGQLGCSFSLDHTSSLDFDVAELQRFKVRFVKIDKAALLNGAGAAQTMRAKSKLEANGIGVIVQKVESEADMRSLIDYDLHYGQGYLFGKPDLQGAYKNTKRARRSGFKEAYG